ncbi:MAG: restriction endonuclease subunit S [Bacteroidetes bacterium]|nr:restriction endonuclease subunit S [Bacteroidota bacterium]
MKSNWEIKKLGEVCCNLDYRRRPITQKDRIIGEIPYYGATGIVDYVRDYIFDEKLVLLGEDGAKWCSGDDCTFIVKGKTWVNNHAHVLIPNREILIDEWLVYNLNFQDLSPYISGMTVPKLNQGKMNEIVIPIPPLPEQHHIVSILDEAFAAIAKAKTNAEQNLRNAKELFESYLQSVFENKGDASTSSAKGWEMKRLGEIAGFRNGMNFTKGSKGEIIKIVGVKDFQNSYWVPIDVLESVTIDGKLNEVDLLKTDDILAVRSNGNPELIGRTLLAGNVLGKVSHSGFTIRIRLNTQSIYPLYLCHYLKTTRTRKELVKSGTGVNIKSLNQVALSSLQISYPNSFTEQQSIIEKLDSLSSETKKLETIYQKKLEDLEELKKSILQKAFSGELTIDN